MSERNSIDKIIGERIRARRLLLGLSQEDLAAELQLSPQQIHKYEKGATKISASRLAAIAHILKSPVEFYFDQKAGNNEAQNELFQMLAEPRVVQALHLFSNLSPSYQIGMLDLMALLAGDEMLEEPEANVVQFTAQSRPK